MIETINHAARAARLREFYGEWAKVNGDSLAECEPPVALPGVRTRRRGA
jgi:hypothetical protein